MNDADRIRGLGDTFRLLAACFYEPEREVLIEQRVCDNLAALLTPAFPEAAEAAGEMAKHLDTLDQKRLSIDHAALFIGPFELLAAPYGSVYSDSKRRIMGDSTLAAQRLYQDAGLRVDVREPADHIAIELEFMSYLCAQEAAALVEEAPATARTCRDRQTDFLARCLTPWVFRFCDAIREGARTPYYRALADCLESFMRSCSSGSAGRAEAAV